MDVHSRKWKSTVRNQRALRNKMGAVRHIGHGERWRAWSEMEDAVRDGEAGIGGPGTVKDGTERDNGHSQKLRVTERDKEHCQTQRTEKYGSMGRDDRGTERKRVQRGPRLTISQCNNPSDIPEMILS